MKKALQLIRSQEWWEYKLPPLLALGYATALSSGAPLYHVAGRLAWILISIIAGAIYVSVINDITDIREDLASGKTNRMAAIAPRRRWMVPALCIVLGLLFIFFLYTDLLSACLYALPWISFSLYSCPPVRLKNRGAWGVIADALGSHLFISLLVVSAVSRYTGTCIDWIWFTAVGIWSFAYGVRGILWHQFLDRENDRLVGLKTYATESSPASFKPVSTVLLLVESAALAVMLFRIGIPYTLLALALYVVLVFIRYKKRGYAVVVILAPRDRPFQIWMGDYYHLFLPLSLLVYAAFIQPWAWAVLGAHMLLFPGKLKWAVKDILPARRG